MATKHKPRSNSITKRVSRSAKSLVNRMGDTLGKQASSPRSRSRKTSNVSSKRTLGSQSLMTGIRGRKSSSVRGRVAAPRSRRAA